MSAAADAVGCALQRIGEELRLDDHSISGVVGLRGGGGGLGSGIPCGAGWGGGWKWERGG